MLVYEPHPDTSLASLTEKENLNTNGRDYSP
jgi:hypothetical protein